MTSAMLVRNALNTHDRIAVPIYEVNVLHDSMNLPTHNMHVRGC